MAVYAAISLVLIDRLDDADRLCTVVIEEGRRRGSLTIVSSFAFARAFASLRRGALRDAEADARWSFEGMLAMVARSESGSTWSLPFLLDALTELGDFAGADQALARIDALGGEQPEALAWAFLLEARGRLRVAQGRLRDGLDDLREAGERWERLDCDRASAARWREDAALALVRLGDPEKPDASPPSSSSLHGPDLPRALGAATRVAGTVAPRADGIPLLREAVELLGDTPARLELARALVELGAALRRDGHRVEARDHLRRGLELAHRAAAAPLAARAREELLAAGGRPRKPIFTGVDALTASELRVARLAAEGRTNRQIAESLVRHTTDRGDTPPARLSEARHHDAREAPPRADRHRPSIALPSISSLRRRRGLNTGNLSRRLLPAPRLSRGTCTVPASRSTLELSIVLLPSRASHARDPHFPESRGEQKLYRECGVGD